MIHEPNDTGLPDELPTPSNEAEDQPAGDTAPQQASPEALHRRRIRSFVTRAGRVSTGQRRAMDELGPRFVVPFTPQQPDWDNVFGRAYWKSVSAWARRPRKSRRTVRATTSSASKYTNQVWARCSS
jgi:hypothetical protein